MRFDHRELGLSFAELGALLGTRALLLNEALEHPGFPELVATSPHNDEHHFNMNVSCLRRSCGTVSCIGGTMAMIMGKSEMDANEYVRAARGRLHELFYPHGINCPWEAITPDVAVEAIDRFLAGKPIHWQDLTSDLKSFDC